VGQSTRSGGGFSPAGRGSPRGSPLGRWPRFFQALHVLGWTTATAGAAWAALAIHYSGPQAIPRDSLAAGLLAANALAVLVARRRPLVWLLPPVFFAVVLVWWLSLPPRNDRNWQPEVAVLAWAEIDRDAVTVHNVRNNVYRTERDFTVRHEDRVFSLARLKTMDLFLSYWGAPLVAHTIASFGFDDGRFLAFSIEARKEQDEEYSAVAGFFRRYELVYVVADERDVIRLRTNYRDEDVYLYRLRAPAARARVVFLAFLDHVNRLHDQAEWYNALTQNCTTSMLGDAGPDATRSWRSWKLLANAHLDELAYDIGAIDRRLPFRELRERSRINDRARAADSDPGFSRLIRRGLAISG
jgi:hypothetical protein